MNERLKLIVIVGPTAAGKTGLSIKLAKDLGCDIISADSRQLYKEMNIGTAKPTLKELKLAKHYFINHKSIHEYYSAGRFEADVLKFLDRYDKKQLVMVGGSGLYIKAVCEGIHEMPDPDFKLRWTLQKRFDIYGLEDLIEELRIKDFDTWNSIDLKNPKRVIRALEVIHQTGLKYSVFFDQKKKKRNFDVMKIGIDLPRDQLFARIDKRVDDMLDQGLLKEVKTLKPWKSLTALQTVGYTEFFDHLDGQYELEEAIRLCKRNSRRYAKRQLTWFRKDKDIQWTHPDNYSEIFDSIRKFISG